MKYSEQGGNEPQEKKHKITAEEVKMKLSKQFAAITKPKDIDEEALGTYLSEELYESLATSAGLQEFNWGRFKAEVDVAIDKATELSGLNKFQELSSKFATQIAQGSILEATKLIKSSLEIVCYKLAKEPGGVNLQLFSDEVKSSTLSDCFAGAVTNLQKILYAMQPGSNYYQKYDYIQNLAAEYVQENHLASHANELHKVNELIHEVSGLYKLVPPHDNSARYRDLSQAPNADFVDNAQFVEYLGAHLSSRQGVHSFIFFLAQDAISRLPQESELKYDSVQAMEKIDEACRTAGINIHEIISAETLTYKADYEAIMEASVMQNLLVSGMIQQDILQFQGKYIVEAPGGWFLFNPEQASEAKAYHKLLDTKHFQGLTVEGKNLEDFLHERLQGLLASGISFDNALMAVIAQKSQELGITTDGLNINSNLFLVTDELTVLREILSPETISSMSSTTLKETGAFFVDLKKDGIDILNGIDSNNDSCMTAVMIAAQKGNAGIVRLLVDRGLR